MKTAALLLLGMMGAGELGVTRAPLSPPLSPRLAPAPDTAVTTKFEVDGIPVILRRNTANEVVVASLYLLAGLLSLEAIWLTSLLLPMPSLTLIFNFSAIAALIFSATSTAGFRTAVRSK